MVSNEMLTFVVVGVTFAGLAVIALATWAYYRFADRATCAGGASCAAARGAVRRKCGPSKSF